MHHNPLSLLLPHARKDMNQACYKTAEMLYGQNIHKSKQNTPEFADLKLTAFKKNFLH